jgi:hypothetical protein
VIAAREDAALPTFSLPCMMHLQFARLISPELASP